MFFIHTPLNTVTSRKMTKVEGIIAIVYFSLQKKTISPYWKLTCGTFNIAMFVAANIAPLVSIFQASYLMKLFVIQNTVVDFKSI